MPLFSATSTRLPGAPIPVGAPPARRLPLIVWSTLALLLAAAVWVHQARPYYPFLADDALISLRYAKRLAAGLGLTWDSYQPVEGYTNLLWVLLCAALGWLGLDWIFVLRLLGGLSAFALVAALVYAVKPRGLFAGLAAILLGVLAACSGPLVVWSIGGLEEILVGASLTWALVLTLPLLSRERPKARAWLPASLALLILTLTRADGALSVAVIAVAFVIARGPSRVSIGLAMKLVSLPLLGFAGQMAFRLAYYHDYMPNTARVKVAFNKNRLLGGWDYVKTGLQTHLGLSLGALLGLPFIYRREAFKRLLFLGLVLLGLGSYLSAIGGDFFPARRLFVPLIAVLLVLVATGINEWLACRAWPLKVVLWLLLGMAVLGLYALQAADGANNGARDERWEWTCKIGADSLRLAFGERGPTMGGDTAGCLPYWTDFPAIDTLGLNDRYLVRHLPPDFGQGWQGHELGSGSYLLARRPDIYAPNGPHGHPMDRATTMRTPGELRANPEFRRLYQLVTIRNTALDRSYVGYFWLLREGGPVGVLREGRELRLPGHFFCNTVDSRCESDERGRLVTWLEPQQTARYSTLELAPGLWRLATDSSAESGVELFISGQEKPFTSGRGELLFWLEAERTIDIRLTAPAKSAVAIRELRFERF